MIKQLKLLSLLLWLPSMQIYSADFGEEVIKITIATITSTSAPELKAALNRFQKLLHEEKSGNVPHWETLTDEQRLQEGTVWVSNNILCGGAYSQTLQNCLVPWRWNQSGKVLVGDVCYAREDSSKTKSMPCQLKKFNRKRKKNNLIEKHHGAPKLWILSLHAQNKSYGWLVGKIEKTIPYTNLFASMPSQPLVIALNSCTHQSSSIGLRCAENSQPPAAADFDTLFDAENVDNLVNFLIDDNSKHGDASLNDSDDDVPEQVQISLDDLEFLIPEMSIYDAKKVFGDQFDCLKLRQS